MKGILKLEEFIMMFFFSCIYFIYLQGRWGFFLALFFVPDIGFLGYLISKKAGAIIYNILHHKGLTITLFAAGYFLNNELLMKVGLIFTAHSCFDRVAGYGLKYMDDFHHTHLGWIGKGQAKKITTW